MSDEGQHEIRVQQIMRDIQSSFPGMQPEQAVEAFYAAITPPPPWAPTKSWRLIPAETTANQGAFAICTFLEGEQKVPMVILGRRQMIENPGVVLYYGTGGGFGTLYRDNMPDKAGEQPWEMAARELTEEVRDDKRNPLLPLTQNRLRLIATGVDYRGLKDGKSAVAYSGFHAPLYADEAERVKTHAARLQTDATYRENCFKATDMETVDIEIMEMAKAATLPLDQFAHPHEAEAIRTLWQLGKAPTRPAGAPQVLFGLQSPK